MADLGNIGSQIHALPALRLCPQLPITRISRVMGDEGASYLELKPVYAVVDSPSPAAGFRSLECYTPGTFIFERPINAGQTVTFSVKCRKNAEYSDLTQAGMGSAPRSTAPYIEIIWPDGVKQRTTKSAGVDSFETLSVGPRLISQNGVAVVKLVAEGNFGDNLAWVPEASRPAVPGPKCWWADLSVTATG